MSGRGNPPLETRPESPTLQEGLKVISGTGQTPGQRRRRIVALLTTVAAHLMVFTALFWPHVKPPRPPEPAAIEVSLLDTPKPTPPVPPEPEIVDTGSPVIAPNPKPPTIHLQSQNLAEIRTPDDMSDVLSDAQLAGAATVGEGGDPGGACDMGQLVQRALRRDPLVRSATENANRIGRSVMLWNGDWVRTGGQDGKGLSAVREAIMWEVGFAPEACRNKPVHGVVLLSLADGRTRFAVGSVEWRWSDLLGLHRTPPDR
jgi:hypothetical protein